MTGVQTCALPIYDGNPAGTQRIDTIEPSPIANGRAAAVIARTRARHTRSRRDVEEKIDRFLRPPHD